ncbi:MAG: acyl-CoA synthetase FdrA [Bacillota bacterium]
MHVCVEIRKGSYYDSVTLMLISKEIKKLDGIKEALVGMGTDLNKELAQNLGLADEKILGLNPNDFFITVLTEEPKVMKNVVDKVDKLLNEKKESSTGEYNPPTFDSAVKYEPDSNLVLISIPGKYAFNEVKKALERDMHVMLFSDNVSIEEERQLKELAKEKGLLMMGPDCGTAIINHIPLAFANVVSRGPIGIIGASGTGTQEVSVLIDKLGSGVSQVIGTGGRDLKNEIGGIMMIEGIKALTQDDETKVIVLISKPPAPEIAEKVLQEVKKSGKPFVVNFIGGDTDKICEYGGVPGYTLEDTAYKAATLAADGQPQEMLGYSLPEDDVQQLIEGAVNILSKEQKYLRGLYTGGTLCDEAMKMLSKTVGDIYSNIPLKPEYALVNVHQSKEHTCVDLGDDVFTVNRPHPMIDPSYRQERLLKEAEDEEIAVVLMDFVIGYGAHPDPVGEMVDSIKKFSIIRDKMGKPVLFIASVCGTTGDPQNLTKQEEKLREAGVLVMPSNAQAVRLASDILKRLA